MKINAPKSPQSGFSLVEIMVGLVVGLLATLIITQVFSTFESQRRKTTGSADAQTNGSIALYSMQKDLQMAGYGMPLPMADKENSPFKCDPSPEYDPDNDPTTNNSIKLFPVEILDGPGDASDVVTVRYSTTQLGAVPVKIVDAANATSAVGMAVDNNLGCSDNDVVVISQGGSCVMTIVADANGTPNTQKNIRLISSTPSGGPLMTGAKLTCMGNWQDYRYEAVNGQLLLNGTPIIDGIVALQAQYGIADSASSNQVSQWVDATAPWNAPTVAERNRIRAVRVAVVARSSQRDAAIVTNQCVTTKGVTNNGPCAWDDTEYDPAPRIDLSTVNGGEWQHFRYRSFETIVPLRNMLWSKDAL